MWEIFHGNLNKYSEIDSSSSSMKGNYGNSFTKIEMFNVEVPELEEWLSEAYHDDKY